MAYPELDLVVAATRQYAAEWPEIQQIDKFIAKHADHEPPTSTLLELHIHFLDSQRACAYRLLRGWGLAILADPVRFVSSKLYPQYDDAWDECLSEVALFLTLTHICENFYGIGKLKPAKRWQAAITLWEDRPRIHRISLALLAQKFQSIGKGEGPMLALAGWAKNELKIYPRVAEALSANMRRTEAFSSELPAAVALAMEQWSNPNDGISPKAAEGKLVGAIGSQLPTVNEPPSAKVLAKLAARVEEHHVALETFAMRQEALRLIDAPDVLTARERRVAQLYFLDGHALKEVAAEVGRAVGTVQATTNNIKEKLIRAYNG